MLVALTAGATVPTDRPIQVIVTLSDRAGAGSRYGENSMRSFMTRLEAEIRRHVGVTFLKTEKPPDPWRLTCDGRAFRDWTRSELENQLRYIGLPLSSVVVKAESSGTTTRPANRERVYSPAVVAEEVTDAILGEPEPAPEPSRWPIIAGIAAVVVGVGVAIYAVRS